MSWSEENVERIVVALETIADNTKTESVNDLAMAEIEFLKQAIRNFGQELQSSLDSPPSSGMEMARRMRELAARMSTFGIPPMFKGKG